MILLLIYADPTVVIKSISNASLAGKPAFEIITGYNDIFGEKMMLMYILLEDQIAYYFKYDAVISEFYERMPIVELVKDSFQISSLIQNPDLGISIQIPSNWKRIVHDDNIMEFGPPDNLLGLSGSASLQVFNRITNMETEDYMPSEENRKDFRIINTINYISPVGIEFRLIKYEFTDEVVKDVYVGKLPTVISVDDIDSMIFVANNCFMIQFFQSCVSKINSIFI